MTEHGIDIEKLPELNKPLLIAGFDGWGNALDISKGMVTHLIHKLQAEPFAKIDPDTFYRYDETRPRVNIEEGVLKSLLPPGGTFPPAPAPQATYTGCPRWGASGNTRGHAPAKYSGRTGGTIRGI